MRLPKPKKTLEKRMVGLPLLPQSKSPKLAGTEFQVSELLSPVVPSEDKMSREDIIKRNCLVLIAKGLNLTKSTEITTDTLKTFIGPKNVSSIFYPRAKETMHNGVANIECLNATVYKQFLRKSVKLNGKWIELQPHPNSLNGSARPDDATLRKLGFANIDTAMANTIAALQNAPNTAPKPLTKKDITAIVEEVVTKENNKLRHEFKADMTTLHSEMSAEAKDYADQKHLELQTPLTNLEQVLGQSMQVLKNIVRPALPAPSSSSKPNML